MSRPISPAASPAGSRTEITQLERQILRLQAQLRQVREQNASLVDAGRTTVTRLYDGVDEPYEPLFEELDALGQLPEFAPYITDFADVVVPGEVAAGTGVTGRRLA